MTNQIEVYFTSENDVESAHANLKTLKSIRDISVEEMQENDDVRMFVPFFPNNLGASSGTSGSFGSYGSFAPFLTKQDHDHEDRNRNDQITHLLRFNVEDEDYQQAMTILGKHNSFMLN